MKKKLFLLCTWAAAALALVSCVKEKEADLPASNTDGGIPFEIIACSADTKTVNDGLSTKWAPGDAVNVFHAVAGTSDYINDGAFTVSDIESGNFTGTLASALDPSQSYDWYIYYHFNPNITSPENTSGGFSTVAAFSQSQTDDNKTTHLAGLPLAGKTTTDAGVLKPVVSMKQLAAVFKVVVTNNSGTDLPVTELVFTSPVSVSGNYYVNFQDPENPVYAEKPEGVGTSVTLNTSVVTKDGESSTYYLAIKPFELEAYDTMYLSVNGYVNNVSLDSDKSFSAGVIYPFTFNYDKKQTSKKKRVVCWGDSYTSANYEEKTTYCKYLQALLGDEWEVYNGGKSGDRTYEIAARQGGFPLVTGSAFTIPADTKTITIDGVLRTHNIMGEEGYYNIRRFNGALSTPCKLVGTNGEEVLCNISSVSKTVDGVMKYWATISRLTPGDPVEIAEHTPIQSYAARDLRDADLTIIYMGANGIFGSSEEQNRTDDVGWQNLATQHWEMINFTEHADSYFVLGQHNARKWDKNGFGDYMESQFGNRFVHLRKSVVENGETQEERRENIVRWLIYSGAYADESEIPQSEIDDALAGNWPKVFWHTSTDYHPNEYAAKVMAKIVYDRMVELGYVD